jgi:UDP-N-acetylmuramoyl-tripeptide--D-alanyl-D-alanine ligase
MELMLSEIVKITNGKLICGEETNLINFTRNTKEVNPGDIFIGLKGNIDGSIYYLDALKNGAKGVIVNKGAIDKYEFVDNTFILEVDDTLKALGEIASLKRSKYNIPIVAITGSVGKTSTKDIVASVLSQKYKVLKTEGNLNNDIGMPLMILKLKDEEVLVLEMGMNHAGEISYLSRIAKPTLAIITNVGSAHIGNLGSRENILKAKLEITEGLSGKLIINNDNDMLHDYYLSNKDNIITVGINNDSDILAKDISYEGNTSYKYNDTLINLKVGGEAFIYNSMLAIAAGKELGLSMEEIKKGIENFELTKNRLQTYNINGYKIIDETYNANFDSMREAITNLGKESGRKIAVLGDMLELGDYSKEIHSNIGKVVNSNNIDLLVTVGDDSKYINDNVTIENVHFSTNEEAINYLKEILTSGDVVLLKASNSLKFIEIVSALKGENNEN